MKNNPEDTALPQWKILMESNDLYNDIRKIYDLAFQRELAQITGAGANNQMLLQGVETGVRAYLTTRQDMTRRKPGKMETRNIDPVARAAHQLYMALSKIENSPNPQLKLSAAILNACTQEKSRGADLLKLARHRHGPSDPLRTLRDISRLLSDAATTVTQSNVCDTFENKRARGDAIREAELAVWSQRKRKTETHPVLALVKAFRPSWERCTAYPYTEGMYRKGLRRTDSPAVDAVLLIGQRIDPSLSRKRVVTAFRNISVA